MSDVNSCPNHPVENVSRDDIMTDSIGFIAKINTQLASQLPDGYKFALPTEAQWEYVCRAGTTTDYNNGGSDEDSLKLVGWYDENSESKTQAVGGLASNSFGLYDMHGNVFEWCADRYAYSYDSGNLIDPTGPDSGSDHILRGGSWDTPPYDCSSWSRFYLCADFRYNFFGFRLALVSVQE